MMSQLPMRQGVGIILLNQNNQVFVGKRKDNPIDKWQMPQGGIDLNETPLKAMRRELAEETSITKIKILKEIENWLEYELPPNLLGKIWKGRYRGQRQKWFIARFTGEDNEINLNTKYPEFIEWKWINYNLLSEVIVDFKREVYKKLKIEIKNFVS
tara:strand:- start:524 stop:991 length:468 start_codon:yes stop_codon:yes gene_type:complete